MCNGRGAPGFMGMGAGNNFGIAMFLVPDFHAKQKPRLRCGATNYMLRGRARNSSGIGIGQRFDAGNAQSASGFEHS